MSFNPVLYSSLTSKTLFLTFINNSSPEKADAHKGKAREICMCNKQVNHADVFCAGFSNSQLIQAPQC